MRVNSVDGQSFDNKKFCGGPGRGGVHMIVIVLPHSHGGCNLGAVEKPNYRGTG